MNESTHLFTRRQALGRTALAAAGIALAAGPGHQSHAAEPSPAASGGSTYPFSLPPLPYAPNALEPFIDAQTMTLHHDKHHQAYVDNLNKALADQKECQKFTVEELMHRLPEVPEKVRTAVRNNGGGHANHSMFWKIMAPAGQRGAGPKGAPGGELAKAITQEFGGVDAMKTAFNEAGTKLFGSGWVWLVADPKSNNKLRIHTTENQDSMLTREMPALFGNDVWEHAYYLKHQNKRADYLQAWWNTLAWDTIAERHAGILAGRAQL